MGILALGSLAWCTLSLILRGINHLKLQMNSIRSAADASQSGPAVLKWLIKQRVKKCESTKVLTTRDSSVIRLRGQWGPKSKDTACITGRAINRKTFVLIVISKHILFHMQHKLQRVALLREEGQSLGLEREDSTCSYVGCSSYRECSYGWCIPC